MQRAPENAKNVFAFNLFTKTFIGMQSPPLLTLHVLATFLLRASPSFCSSCCHTLRLSLRMLPFIIALFFGYTTVAGQSVVIETVHTGSCVPSATWSSLTSSPPKLPSNETVYSSPSLTWSPSTLLSSGTFYTSPSLTSSPPALQSNATILFPLNGTGQPATET